MASRSGTRAVSVEVHGLDKLDRFLREQIAGEDLNTAKRALRQGTKKIANDILIPALHSAADASGVPIAPAVARTARTRTDRIVTVRIGAVNPKLRGFRSAPKGRAASGGVSFPTHTGRRAQGSYSDRAQRWRTSLAFGSDRGPHPFTRVNRYGVPRRESYYVTNALAAAWDAVKDAYGRLIGDLLDQYGRYR